MDNKNRKILISELVILAAILLIILLPNLLGRTKENDISANSISTEADINGKPIGFIKNDSIEKILSDSFPDSPQISVDTTEEASELLKDGEVAVLAVVQKDIAALLEKNSDFVQFAIAKFAHSYDSYEDSIQFVLLKENVSFAVTSKTNKDVNSKGTNIGVIMGSDIIDVLETEYSNANVMMFNSNSDVIEAVRSGKVDYGVFYLTSTSELYEKFDDIAVIPDVSRIAPSSFVVPKTERGKIIYQELTQYIDEIRANGKYDEIDEHWLNNTENIDYLDDYVFTGEKGTLKICTSGTWIPKTYMANNKITGVFLELVYDFCSKYGYIPDVTVAEFSAELSGISSGMYDIMADIACETEERSKLVYFTQNIVINAECFVTKGNIENVNEVSKASVFLSTLKKNFEKTFIHEKRYEMILRGLLTTIELALLSIILGSMLSCVICKLRMSDNSLLTAFARIYIKVLQCTPIVVMLMVFYYVIFKGLSAFWVCIIGFSLDFSAYCSEELRTSIESVPAGQFRAGIALGFTKHKAFQKIVLPQALIRFLPLYSGQIIGTIKITSVAGYITVMDLTRVSDLVRARTFEAFFPLVTTAIIYFAISSMLIIVLKQVENSIDPTRRRQKVAARREM